MKKGICIIGFLAMCACDEPPTSPIPSGSVNIELNLNFADSDLVPALATKSFTQPRLTTDRLGFGGVLVVNGYSSNGSLNLYAYDLACPHEVNRNVRVIPGDDGTAHCEKCGSVFLTMWGTGLPEKNSPTKHPLRSYTVRPLGGNQFVVAN